MMRSNMRVLVCAALGLCLLLGPVEVAQAAEEAEDDFDIPEDDEFDADLPEGAAGAGGDGPPAGGPPVDDVDESYSEEKRQNYMSACYSLTMTLVVKRRELLEAKLDEITKQAGMSREQAANSVVFSWMMQCYLNMDDSRMPGSGAAITEEVAAAALAPRPDVEQQVQSASKRQWSLLESVAIERQKLEQEAHAKAGGASGGSAGGSGGGSRASPGAAVTPPLSGMSSSSQALYVLAVFAVIFGLGALAVMKLSKKAAVEERERSSKSSRKADKAEKKLAKKRM
eukprot:TRINITY_DN9823_c1_g1_i1.p1 TRINITY_DN9823_c1_g1~~TRINITY_DN9823_c1_g1_i1.p1  ORF type:complete len:284 (+),score=106.11 TRINITY_DN9823_c1_g1_i1:184-1035(+)